jgi:metal-sulfur cluster biosynthetic enzyme
MAPRIIDCARQVLQAVPGVTDIEVLFDASVVWDADRTSPHAQAMLASVRARAAAAVGVEPWARRHRLETAT